MLRKGLKEIGILKDEGSRSYHQLNPTSIGSVSLDGILPPPRGSVTPFSFNILATFTHKKA